MILRFAKRDALANKIIGQIGGQHAPTDGALAAFRVDGQGLDQSTGHGEQQFEDLGSLEHGLLIFLQIFVVCGRKPF